MQRTLIQAVGIVLMVLIANYAYSGTIEAPAVPKEKGAMMKTDPTGSAGGVAPSKSGSSIVERDKKRYENQKRAAERRAAEMKKAEKAKKPKPGSSVAERDKQRYENQKRAAERRAVEMKKAEESEKTTDMNKKDPVDEQGKAAK